MPHRSMELYDSLSHALEANYMVTDFLYYDEKVTYLMHSNGFLYSSTALLLSIF
jgi:hypothetical protein